MIRSISAVLAGIVTLSVLTFAIEAATTPWLMRTFPQSLPSSEAMQANVPMKLFILGYSTLCMIAAGYVSASIARRNPVRLAILMAAIQVALTLAAMTAFYDHAPLWAWLAGIALMLPAAWLGARFQGKRRSRPAGAP